MVGTNDDWRPRVPIELEEAPAFLFLSRGHVLRRSSYTAANEDGKRAWEITWSRQTGPPGGLAQRVLLALYALYEDQSRHPHGHVYYSLAQLADMLEVARANRGKLTRALRELEGVNIYVSGEPLADGGQITDDPVFQRAARQGRATFLYRFLEGGSFTQVEETLRGQRQLFAVDQVSPRLGRRPTSRASLSRYAVFALNHQTGLGRIVPSWVLPIKLPYAVRLTRLVGKRANGRPELVISPDRLIEFLPAIGTDGRKLTYREIRRRLEPAYELLTEVGFLRDVQVRDDGKLLFKLGREALADRRKLSEEEKQLVDMIVAELGPEANRNRPFYRECLLEGIGADWMLGLLRECVRSGGQTSLAARFGRSLQDARDLQAAKRGPTPRELERAARRAARQEERAEVARAARESLEQVRRAENG